MVDEDAYDGRCKDAFLLTFFGWSLVEFDAHLEFCEMRSAVEPTCRRKNQGQRDAGEIFERVKGPAAKRDATRPLQRPHPRLSSNHFARRPEQSHTSAAPPLAASRASSKRKRATCCPGPRLGGSSARPPHATTRFGRAGLVCTGFSRRRKTNGALRSPRASGRRRSSGDVIERACATRKPTTRGCSGGAGIESDLRRCRTRTGWTEPENAR